MADRMIRGGMLLAAYRTAEREGMDAINRVWDRDQLWAGEPEKTPEHFARFLTDRSAGIWGDPNRLPVCARSSAG